MEQKNGVQTTLANSGILFKIEERQAGLPEIISEETFVNLLEMSLDGADQLPTDINEVGFEDEDLDEDGLMFM